jgi:ABC-type oligopeptide transport system ATPase subunit
VLEVKNITKEFEKKVSQKETIKFLADNDISFDAKEGEEIEFGAENIYIKLEKA